MARVIAAAWLVACGGTAPDEGGLVFLRDAVWVPGAVESGQPVPGGSLVARRWTAGESVDIGGIRAVAPVRAECRGLFSVGLGDVSRLTAMGGAAPDTALAWSPDGRRLAVGSYRGEVLVVDGYTGEVQVRRALSETIVRDVAWSPDGATLYAGEQSPDALVHALHADTLADRWTLRLADRVGSSSPPAGDDLYGVYALPATYGLQVLPDGDLVVAAVHGWTDGSGHRLNRSVVLRVGADGAVRASWPVDGAADAVVKHPAIDVPGGLLAVAVSRSADGDPPEDLPLGGVLVLDLHTLRPQLAVPNTPLGPWYTEVEIWRAVDVSRADNAVLMGLSDGRVRVVGLDGVERLSLDAGTPVLAGDVPIGASVGYGALLGDTLVVLTSTTLIPWGAASADLRPPTVHPNANSVRVADARTGVPRWSWTGSHDLTGMTVSPDGRSLVVGAGPRSSDQRTDLFGALVLALDGPQRSGEDRLLAVCPTRAPVFFRQAVASDGRIAVAEHPWLDDAGAVRGAYQVTVLR